MSHNKIMTNQTFVTPYYGDFNLATPPVCGDVIGERTFQWLCKHISLFFYFINFNTLPSVFSKHFGAEIIFLIFFPPLLCTLCKLFIWYFRFMKITRILWKYQRVFHNCIIADKWSRQVNIYVVRSHQTVLSCKTFKVFFYCQKPSAEEIS